MSAEQENVDAFLRGVREFGLTYPETNLKSPWPGHNDLAVRDKTFAYLSVEGQPFSISCKLPFTGEAVKRDFPRAVPTAYGLGKSGWVSVEWPPGELPDIVLIKNWIDESYRAQAPKKLARLVAPPEA